MPIMCDVHISSNLQYQIDSAPIAQLWNDEGVVIPKSENTGNLQSSDEKPFSHDKNGPNFSRRENRRPHLSNNCLPSKILVFSCGQMSAVYHLEFYISHHLKHVRILAFVLIARHEISLKRREWWRKHFLSYPSLSHHN